MALQHLTIEEAVKVVEAQDILGFELVADFGWMWSQSGEPVPVGTRIMQINKLEASMFVEGFVGYRGRPWRYARFTGAGECAVVMWREA